MQWAGMEGLGFDEVLKMKECHQCQSMICCPPPLVVGHSPMNSVCSARGTHESLSIETNDPSTISYWILHKLKKTWGVISILP